MALLSCHPFLLVPRPPTSRLCAERGASGALLLPSSAPPISMLLPETKKEMLLLAKKQKDFFFPLLCALKISCSPAAFNRKHPPCLHTGVALQMLGTSRAGGRGGQPRAGGRSGPVCPGDRVLGGWMQPSRAAGSGIHHCQVQFVFACRETSRGGGSTAEKGRCLLKRKCLNAV